jgi:hypothetical protein
LACSKAAIAARDQSLRNIETDKKNTTIEYEDPLALGVHSAVKSAGRHLTQLALPKSMEPELFSSTSLIIWKSSSSVGFWPIASSTWRSLSWQAGSASMRTRSLLPLA